MSNEWGRDELSDATKFENESVYQRTPAENGAPAEEFISSEPTPGDDPDDDDPEAFDDEAIEGP